MRLVFLGLALLTAPGVPAAPAARAAVAPAATVAIVQRQVLPVAHCPLQLEATSGRVGPDPQLLKVSLWCWTHGKPGVFHYYQRYCAQCPVVAHGSACANGRHIGAQQTNTFWCQGASGIVEALGFRRVHIALTGQPICLLGLLSAKRGLTCLNSSGFEVDM